MKFSNILDTLAQADVANLNQATDRRSLIRNWAPRMAMSALPLLSLVIPLKAAAHPTEDATDLLKMLLAHTRLESSFLELALRQARLFPASLPQDRACIELISENKKAHLSFVALMMQSAGSDDSGVPRQFDYTGGRGRTTGPFADVMEDYLSFLSLAQMLSDFGVRAIKGAILSLTGNPEILQGFLQLQSAEARHAARLRQLRNEHGLADIRPWITQASSDIPNEVALDAYAGEDNILQGGLDLVKLTGLSNDSITEAFDEPLGHDAVWAILGNFVQA